MQQGDCFHRGTSRLLSHPWIILSDPNISPDDVLIVNYTDARNISDDACELDIGDHPGVITKPTRVNYRLAKVASIVMLKTCGDSELLIHKAPVPRETIGQNTCWSLRVRRAKVRTSSSPEKPKAHSLTTT